LLPSNNSVRSISTISRKQSSISTRLRWSYFISSTVPLLVVGASLIGFSFHTQQANTYNSQAILAKQVAQDISTYITALEGQALSFTQNIQPSKPDTRLEITARALISTNFPNLRELAILDSRGQETARFTPQETYPKNKLVRRTGMPLIQNALRGTGGRSNIVHTSKGQPILTLALPVRDKAKVVGVVSAEISAVPIEQALRVARSNTNSVAYLLVNERREVMLNDGTPGWIPPPDFEPIFKAESGVTEYRGGNGKMVVGARAPVSPMGWSVIVEQASNEAFASVRLSVAVLATVVIVTGLLALGWAIWQAQQLLRPLAALREGAAALGAGHLEHRLNIESSDEVGQLAQTFNQMAAQLQASLLEVEHQNERLREGLHLARDIQMGLLPTYPPWNQAQLAVEACSIPAYEVGGDFYTYLNLPQGQFAIAVGDVSGKGVGAALMMALTSSSLESKAREACSPAKVLQTLNQQLYSRMHGSHMNSALIYAIFDAGQSSMTVANAGMIAPFILHCGNDLPTKVEMLNVGGLPIGSMLKTNYSELKQPLAPHDTILFVSDGVVEAHNEAGELFGFERLESILAQFHAGQNVELLVKQILQSVLEFAGTAAQHDDITIMAVHPLLHTQAKPLLVMQRAA